MKPVSTLLLAAALAIGSLSGAIAADSPSPLVNTEWATKNQANSKVRLLEVSVDPGLFEKGHIPGALNVAWHTDLVDPVRRDIISKEQFEALASRLGITPQTTVVFYGDNNNWFAAWGAWIFKVYGHKDVRLLDGGRVKWELEKRPYSIEVASVAPTSYKVETVNTNLRALIADVVAVAEGKVDSKLVDIRSPDEYSGKVIAPAGFQELAIRAGHVPGAINAPWKTAANEDGTFKSAQELKEIYTAKGVDGTKPVIVYCRIGERSAHTWFALSQILGYEVKQYDGSWTEYGNAVGVPINNPTRTVWTGK
jgi:thiosulfate/3-mercaptopyruvate sulfurtransferase